MTGYRAVVVLGVGVTTFLVASIIGFEVFGGDFPSVFYVLPIALLVAGGGAVLAWVALTESVDRRVASVLVGIATFGYSVLLLQAVRYAIATTRPYLPVDTVALLSVATALVVGAASWYADAGPRADDG